MLGPCVPRAVQQLQQALPHLDLMVGHEILLLLDELLHLGRVLLLDEGLQEGAFPDPLGAHQLDEDIPVGVLSRPRRSCPGRCRRCHRGAATAGQAGHGLHGSALQQLLVATLRGCQRFRLRLRSRLHLLDLGLQLLQVGIPLCELHLQLLDRLALHDHLGSVRRDPGSLFGDFPPLLQLHLHLLHGLLERLDLATQGLLLGLPLQLHRL
mmetsp:Transcript_24597/g.50327  ORF Transcript_24597/g.50327 Transcript_24597/m.50327 type:complete len:210 (-) Transcript_24597:807-1436(-)